MPTVIVLVTCAVTLAAWRSPRLMERLVMYPPAVTFRGQWDRLLGYGLVHADMWHLMFNMLTLWSFGTAAEYELALSAPRYGPLLLAAIYVGALPISIWPSYRRHRRDSTYVSLGASGSVSAVLAFVVMKEPANLVYVFGIPMPGWMYLIAFVTLSIWLGRRPDSRINHNAHLVGTFLGIAVAAVL